MSVQPGSRFGGYDIGPRLGAGGMGEVYRARDSRLGRDVALKVLPASFAGDPDRLMRFEREARTLAALNHPNIATIFEMCQEAPGGEGGQAPLVRALAMELVEGEDLSQRIARGALPADEVIALARQIAAALEAAHDAGIIHRDLKPANIKVREDGTVKVLDFGLAKLADPVGSGAGSGDAMNSPTMTSPALTAMGLILGTAAYMAPEQAKGRSVDRRADIWAFGVVLYEMLSGRRAFEGEDVSTTLAAVLMRDPDWAAIPAGTPAAVRHLMRRCLERDPKRRLRDIGEARLLLDAPATVLGDADGTSMAAAPARSRLPWVLAAGATLLAVVLASMMLWRPADAGGPSVPVRFVVPTTADSDLLDGPVLSPDGQTLVFKDGNLLHVRGIAEFGPRPLKGTEGATAPFMSPDGASVGFYADGRLRRVALAGGDAVDITQAEADSPGAGWGPDGRIYFSRGWNDAALVAIPEDGGAMVEVSTLDRQSGERGHWWPHPLPDGRHVLFTVWYASAGLSDARVAVLDLQTGTHRVLFPGAMPRYAAGQVLYYRAGTWVQVAFDPATMATRGDPVRVLPDAIGLSPQGGTLFPVSLADNGTVAYLPGDRNREREYVWVALDGRIEPTAVSIRTEGVGDLSPDGHRVAVGTPQAGSAQVVVADLISGAEQRLAAPGMNWGPRWHPDGRRLAITSMRKGDFDTFLRRMDGTGEEAVEDGPVDVSPEAWLPDGVGLVAKDWLPDGTTSIFLIETAQQTRRPLVTGLFQKGQADVSSDGRWLAVTVDPGGVWHVYLRQITGGDRFEQLSRGAVATTGGVRWSRTANRVFYFREDWTLVATDVIEQDGRVEGRERTLTTMRQGALVGTSPSGDRVLVARPVQPASSIPTGYRVIVNGLAALRAESSR